MQGPTWNYTMHQAPIHLEAHETKTTKLAASHTRRGPGNTQQQREHLADIHSSADRPDPEVKFLSQQRSVPGKTQPAWGAAEYEPTVWGGHISLHTDSSPLRPCSTRGFSCHMRSHHNPAPAQMTDNCPLLTMVKHIFSPALLSFLVQCTRKSGFSRKLYLRGEGTAYKLN